MNLFDRFNNRFARSSQMHTVGDVNSGPMEQPPPPDNINTTFVGQNNNTIEVTVSNYDCPEKWVNFNVPPSRTAPNISCPPNDVTSIPRTQSSGMFKSKLSVSASSSQLKRAKTPMSSFYNVSSDEDEQSDEEDAGKDVYGEVEISAIESASAFERRSLRIRRSLDKAKAALPVDFADRIGVAPMMTDSTYRDRSTTHHTRPRVEAMEDPAGSDEEDYLGRPPTGDEEFANDEKPEDTEQHKISASSKGGSFNPPESLGIVDDKEQCISSSTASSKSSTVGYNQYGIQWDAEPLRPLEEIMPDFRKKPSGSTYLLRSVAQRSGCRCALCGHDSLLLFPVLDASLALANWNLWSPVTKGHGRFSHHERSQPFHTTTTEIQSKLVVFRQCRGWYEVLNEDQQPIPHLTTVEQVRRAKPSTFLIRRDLRCLAAPPSLLIPPIKEARATGDGPQPPPFPSSVIAIATAPETLMNSTSEVLQAGTLMHYVTYLPHCSVKRGRKIKELGLLLATIRSPGSPMYRNKGGDNSSDLLPSRAYYIGLEDTTPAVFPPKFAISPVAGPENISGVHSLASILRKFRLPLSVRPIFMQDNFTSVDRSPKEPHVQPISFGNSSLLSCGLAAVQGLSFGDHNYLRLESVCRSDLLIISPVSSPERLFLITPSMLPDHVFQLGTSADPAFLRLLENHRLQATNFLAVAHPKETLNYLVRHMRDVTREQRDSYATRKNSKVRTGGRNSAASVESQMTQEEIYRAYDEIDEIYFYIRHGYYPSKNRRPETPVKYESPQPTNKAPKEQGGQVTQPDVDSSVKRGPIAAADSMPQSRTGMPTAEELLAASLGTPVRNNSFHSKWTNGSGTLVTSTYRVQPKEYGI
ncbi:hypothetical protein EG68_00123 [Paragonimus skrjabini miyazakii]|uniref:CABIT domain-containing protein n=1 Tax=Paragonimus skrjabini miyazakii TaxID=59628 RepID=A0A8S9Z6Q0_9TREM|nr:hypothetical protein EG68_00123 [Paragonimus skrjabini miyazakii]